MTAKIASRLFSAAWVALLLSACSANSGPGTSTTTVIPATPQAAAVSLSVSPHSLKVGDTAIATWATQNASECTATGAWSGALALSNEAGQTLGPFAQSGTYTFGVNCKGPGGSGVANQTITVGVVPAPGIQFNLSPTAIKPGDSATITWSSTNTTGCTGTGGTGSDGWAGAHPSAEVEGFNTGAITTAGDYTYNLSCEGAGGSAEESRVLTVSASAPAAPPTVSFTAQPAFLQPGQSSTFSWTASNATSCTASGGTGTDGWQGTRPVSSTASSIGPLNVVGNYSYTLTCSGDGGSASKSIVLVVSSSPLPPPVTVSIDVSPVQIVAGSSANLSWTSANADTCLASGSWSGPQALMGSAVSTGTLSTPGVYSFTLSCSGSGGTASSTAVTSLTVKPAAASIATLSATPSTLQTGQSVTLSWTTSDATSCTASGGSGADAWSGTVPVSSAGMSIGPLNAGNYVYTLTCTGPGGASAPRSVNVTVSNSPAAPLITVFTTLQTDILVGQSTTLIWSSIGATTCTASGGTGSDGWGGAVATTGVGLVVGPIGAAGSVVYTLTCTGPGGTSAPTSVTIHVSALPIAATITTFTAAPVTVQSGQSTSLSWSSSGATSCTAGGGSGSDGWSGAVGVASASTVVGPLTAAGTVTYSLTCSGPGGSSSPSTVDVTVNAAVPGQPTVTLNANNSNPAQIQPGQSVTLKWSSTNATSCTASGGAPGDGWSGSRPISSTGVSVGPIATPGVYSYTLTCSGAGGSGSSTVALTVISSLSADCGIGEPSTYLLAPAASASSAVQGICLVGCGVSNLGNVTDANVTNYATLSVAVGVAATVSLKVKDNTTRYPAGRKAGFLMADPNALLSLSLLQNVRMVTLLQGSVQETAGIGDVLELKALGLLNDPNAGFVEFKTTKPFDSVRVDAGSLASVLSRFRVYGACVSLQ